MVGIEIPEHMVFVGVVTLLILAVGLAIRSRLSVENPGTFQITLEALVSFIVETLESNIGPKGRKFLPVLGTLFIFILFSNLIGQVPGFESPTANINIPFGCAITLWLYYHFQGVKAQGPVNYALHFAFPPGVPKAMFVLMLPIELISHLSRMMSLTLRLFGNIFAEHLVVLILAFLVPFLAPLPIQALGLVVGPLQAFIFMTLGAIYLAEATAVAEHH